VASGCSLAIKTDDLTCFQDPKLGTKCGVCGTSKVVCGPGAPVCETPIDGMQFDHPLFIMGITPTALDRVDSYAYAWQQSVLWGVTTTVFLFGRLDDYEQDCNVLDPICDCSHGMPCTIPHAKSTPGPTSSR
jgi:hypothetical protein